MKRIAPVLLAVAATVSFASAAEAGRNRDATLAVSPADAVVADLSQWEPAVGDDLVFSGCGYEPGKGVSVRVDSPYAYSFAGAKAGADGCFTTTNTYTALQAGDYKAHAWQSSSRRADASVNFAVSP